MKLCCISDTHNQFDIVKIPDADIVVHAGDATDRGTLPEIAKFLFQYGSLPHKHKIFVAGNHDFLFQDSPTLARKMCKDNGIVYLEDEEITLEGIKFYGSPWQPWFHSWAFNLDPDCVGTEDVWSKIPDDTQVLITHGPPRYYLDTTFDGNQIGCPALRNRLFDLYDLKCHIFGHNHHGYGMIENSAGVKFINAALCGWEKVKNEPIVMEL